MPYSQMRFQKRCNKRTSFQRWEFRREGMATTGKIDSPTDVTRHLARQLLANETAGDMTKSKIHEADMYDFGFERDKAALYHTRQDSWQKDYGYLDIFDTVFHVATHMDKDKFDFNFEGEKLRIWIWKGDYLNLGAGAELAIYKAIDPFEIEYVKNDKVNATIKDGVRYITKSGMRYITRDGMHYVVDEQRDRKSVV